LDWNTEVEDFHPGRAQVRLRLREAIRRQLPFGTLGKHGLMMAGYGFELKVR